MIFRRLCTPKKNNDAMHRLIFFGAQIHSESHGPIRRFLVDRVLGLNYLSYSVDVGILADAATRIITQITAQIAAGTRSRKR